MTIERPFSGPAEPVVYSRGEAVFDGCVIRELAEELEPPFWLFSERILRQNASDMKMWFSRPDGGPVRIYFSAKTNCEIAVLKIIRSSGLDAELACGHELELCTRAGFDPASMCFDGPYKRPADIKAALGAGVRMFNADSVPDAARISGIARAEDLSAKLTFRLNLGIQGVLPDLAERYIGKFGVPVEKATESYTEAAAMKGIEIAGVSTHIGSQIPKVSFFIEAVRRLFRTAQKLEALGFNMEEVNLGGGFPSHSLKRMTFARSVLSLWGIHGGADSAPLSEYGRKISKEFMKRCAGLKSDPVMSIEPGRAVASTAGIFVAPVVAVKDDWVFLDASTNYLPESFFFARRAIVPAAQPGRGKSVRKYNLAGSSLNSSDVLGLGMELPELEEGDLLVLLDAGAYTVGRANRFTTLCPPVYLIDRKGEPVLIRRQEEASDVMAPMVE